MLLLIVLKESVFTTCVFQGLDDKTVVGTFKMGDGRIFRVGTEAAA